MRLSWNEIRARAAAFAEEWKDAHYERGESQTFYNEFFHVFGVTRRHVASFEEPVKRLGNKRGFIDLFWKGVLLVEQKSAGGNLERAKKQALDYFPDLKEYELPRYLLVSDFQNFELYDLDEGTDVKFRLKDLYKKVEYFTFILGVEKRTFHNQGPVNIQASELMGKLHNTLKAAGYEGHDLERFLVRLLFCLFADDTGIFEPRDIFEELIRERTQPDGSDTGPWLAQLFEVLNTPEERRHKNLDEDLNRFPYVNGDLFRERLAIPSFDSRMRRQLLEVCAFSWNEISPAIFGSLFQSVMDDKERRAQGAHYTTEKNILKLIHPLFLDDLHAEFDQIKRRRDGGRRKALELFHEKIATLTFFDPACGCGNFLIISYRELRLIEIELLKLLWGDKQLKLDVSTLKIDVDHFYGIEISEFPVRIAEVALWMMDHLMNSAASVTFGQPYLRIPLRNSPHIHRGDALELDWQEVLPSRRCSYVFGNPPFGGAKYQTDAQRAQVKRIARLGGSGGTLDYVAAWFIKSGEYVSGGDARIGFVATNSITQGEQVAQLWPVLFERIGLEISFAHRTFAWGSDARGKAHVHVVIIGLTRRANEPAIKRLFTYDDVSGDPIESLHSALTAYLFDASTLGDRHLVVRETSEQLCGQPKLIIGSQPIEDGNFIFDSDEKEALLAREPDASQFLRPFVGSEEFINGGERYILYLQNAQPNQLRDMPEITRRIAAVRKFRLASKRASTRQLAATPCSYLVTVVPECAFLVIPEVTLGASRIHTHRVARSPTIPSNLVKVLLDADLWHFGILTSRMHMAWLRHIGGRLESRYRYSSGIVYNPFPWPQTVGHQQERVRALAKAVLEARAKFPGASLADLYDADLMKPELRRAHAAMDAAVDKLYRGPVFSSDRDRVEHLFALYEKLVSPLTAPVGARKIRRLRRPSRRSR